MLPFEGNVCAPVYGSTLLCTDVYGSAAYDCSSSTCLDKKGKWRKKKCAKKAAKGKCTQKKVARKCRFSCGTC